MTRDATIDVELPDGSETRQSRTLYDTRWGPMLTAHPRPAGLPVDADDRRTRWATPTRRTSATSTTSSSPTRRSRSRLDAIEQQLPGHPVGQHDRRRHDAARPTTPTSARSRTSPNAKIADCSAALGRCDGRGAARAGPRRRAVRVRVGHRPGRDRARHLRPVEPAVAVPPRLRDQLQRLLLAHQPDAAARGLLARDRRRAHRARAAHPARAAHGPGASRRLRRRCRARFTSASLQDAVFNNRQYLGELWRDELVASAASRVDVRPTCATCCADWDVHDDLDSRGALLFRRFASRATDQPAPQSAAAGSVTVPDAVRRRRPGQHAARASTGTRPPCGRRSPTRSRDLRGAGIPLDAPLRDCAVRAARRRADPDPRRAGHASASSTPSTSPGTRGEGYTDVAARLELRAGRRAARRSAAPKCARSSPTRSPSPESPLVRRPDPHLLEEEVGVAAVLSCADAQGEVRLPPRLWRGRACTIATAVTRPSRDPLQDPDLGVVADHEAVGARLARPAGDQDVRPSSEDSMRPSRPERLEPSSRIECSTSAVSTTQPSPTAV